MRKALIAVVVASGLFGFGAFAADLVISPADVSSGSADVVSCANEAVVNWTVPEEFDTAEEDFVVDDVVVTFYDAGGELTSDCGGDLADIALKTGADADSATWEDFTSATVVGNTVTFSGVNVSVNSVHGVSVMVNETEISTNAGG